MLNILPSAVLFVGTDSFFPGNRFFFLAGTLSRAGLSLKRKDGQDDHLKVPGRRQHFVFRRATLQLVHAYSTGGIPGQLVFDVCCRRRLGSYGVSSSYSICNLSNALRTIASPMYLGLFRCIHSMISFA